MRIARLLLCAAVALPVVAVAPVRAQGAAQVISTVAFEFYPGGDEQPNAPLQILAGSTLVYVNLDPLGSHTVTSDKRDRKRRPIFDSGEGIGLGQYTFVKGIERLKPGTYKFHCSLHTSQMKGVLTIVGPPV